MSQLVSLTELATELAKRHEQAPSGQITVIPVIVEDLQKALPVLSALCQMTEGELLHARAPELQRAVRRASHVALPAAVAHAFGPLPGRARHVDVLNIGGDLIDVAFPGAASVAATPGEQTVLGVARAVMHGALDDHSFGAVVYEEHLVDVDFKRAIWALAMRHLNGMKHPSLRTLVFVTQAQISISLHCEPGYGFQLAVDGGRLLRRKPEEDLNVEVSRLGRLHAPFVLYLGAGFSFSSQLPLGNTLRDSAIKRLLGFDPADVVPSVELAERFYTFVTGKGWLTPREDKMGRSAFVEQLTLEQVIRVEQNVDASLPTLLEFQKHHDSVIETPGPAVLSLGPLLERAIGRVILVEVNFDELIERHTKAPLRVFSSATDFEGAADFIAAYLSGTAKEIPLLKLHGTISDPMSCVVNADQTETGIGKSKLDALHALLGSDEHPRPWVYVGTSMRDLDLVPVFVGEEFARGLDERWVSPYLVASVEDFVNHREPHWRKTAYPSINHRLITEAADPFFAALAAHWTDTDKLA